MSINNFALYKENKKKRKGKNIKKLSQRRNLWLNVFFMSFWVPDISLRRLYNPCVALTFSRVLFFPLQVRKCEIVLVMKVVVVFFLRIFENGMGDGKIIIYSIPTLIIPTDVAISTWIVFYYTNEINVPLVYHSNLLTKDKKKTKRKYA